MGCSASRLVAHPAKNPENRSSSSSSPLPSCSKSSRPVRRAFSLPTPLIHHPPLSKGDTHHLVSLTSTTYGSLLLIDRPVPKIPNPEPRGFLPQSPIQTTKPTVPTDLDSSLSPDSVINTWELMDGLDDFDFDSSDTPMQKSAIFVPPKCSEIMEEDSSPAIKPLWQHLSEECMLSKLDSNVSSSYLRALSSRHLNSNDHCKRVRSVGSSPLNSYFPHNWSRLPGGEDRIVIFFTSLRGIRKTYEDCCLVLMIFRGFRVAVDERDISMDSSYRKELQSAMGGKTVSLPQVFIRGKSIGGAEEIKQLNENGELAKILEGFPIKDHKFVCTSCGDVRFVPCPNCNGSRKVFEEEEGELKRCPFCNENGLVRCPDCCS